MRHYSWSTMVVFSVLSCFFQRAIIDIELVDAVVSRKVDEIFPSALEDNILLHHSEILDCIDPLEGSIATDFSGVIP